MIGNIGMTELLLIFVVVLLVFGAKRIPEIARGMGKGIREFKDATREIQRDLALDEKIHIPQSPSTNYSSPQYSASQQPAPTPAPTVSTEPATSTPPADEQPSTPSNQPAD